MGTGTLQTAYTNGQIIDATHPNEITASLLNSFVGRNSSGVPESGKSLGTIALPWGTLYTDTIVLNGTAIDPSQIQTPQNKITSGQTRTTSNQPAFILADGAADELTVEATATNLIVDINGTAYTLSADASLTSMTLAPSSNNTCLVDDLLAADQESTRTWGEYGAEFEYITVDNMGSEISSLVGTWQSFGINDGANDEYFLAFIESTTKLSKIKRGYFLDSSYVPINRIKFANNDVITLMKSHWVFIENNGTITSTVVSPVVSGTAPSAPATNDYWLDLNNNQWKRYSGSAWEVISRNIIGLAICDDTNCIAARSFDFYALHKIDNTIELELSTTEISRTTYIGQKIVVNGNLISFDTNLESWNITNQLANSSDMYDATEQASRHYYYYIKDDGDAIISDIRPYWEGFKYGWYHPHNPWRCVGAAFNDSGSDLENIETYGEDRFSKLTEYDLTTTGTNWTTITSLGMPYLSKNSSGNNMWRFRFNISGSVSSAVADLTITVAGLTFRNVSSIYQAIVASSGENRDLQKAHVNNGAGTINAVFGSTTSSWSFSGDVELEQKPDFVS